MALASFSETRKLVLRGSVLDDPRFLDYLDQIDEMIFESFHPSHPSHTLHLFDCVSITRLSFRNCDHVTAIPDELGHLVNLVYLAVDHCRNFTSLPTTIDRLQRLNELILRKCDRLVQLPATLIDCRLLNVFVVDNCPRFTRLEPWFAFMPTLKQCIIPETIMPINHCLHRQHQLNHFLLRDHHKYKILLFVLVSRRRKHYCPPPEIWEMVYEYIIKI